VSRCDSNTHAQQKWLYTLAPDLSELRDRGRNEVGVWLDCPRCSSTLLIEIPAAPERPVSAEVRL